MSVLINKLKKFYLEIKHSLALRLYGVALALIHPLTALFWSEGYFLRFSGHVGGTCHSFWQGCNPGFFPTGTPATVVFWLYTALGLATAVLFLIHQRTVLFAIGGLWLTNLIKAAIYIHDYQFMGNYHYMPFLITLAYLLWPHRRISVSLLLVGFYVAAGFLKLNPQWFLGEALVRPAAISPELFTLACIAVVFLEMIFVLFLLSEQSRARWLALSALAVFHAVSYYWVQHFYPTVMALLLSIFPLLWTLEPDRLVKWPDLNRWPKAAFLPLIVFVLMQLPPRLQDGDPAVTTQGRAFALNMFDGWTTCFDFSLLRFENSMIETSFAELRNLAVRIKCDPLVYESEMRSRCARMRERADFKGGEVWLISKRRTDSDYITLLSGGDVCQLDSERKQK